MYITDRKNASGVQPSRFSFSILFTLYAFFLTEFLFPVILGAVTSPGLVHARD